jgi:tetratricopeptide (TPR) repeat protein
MRGDPDVKWRGSRGQSVGLLGVAVLLAVMGVLVDKWDGPSWLMVGLAICAAGGGVWLEWRKGRAAAQDAQSSILSTSSQPHLGAGGRFRTVGETGWDEFRVQPAAVELRYIPRNVQQDLHDRVVEGRPVLVVGHSMSGKTRMAYEVVRQLYSDWPVWIPERPDGLAQLMASGVPQQTVVWLDDLEAFLSSEHQLRLPWLTQLENAGCRVVATIRASEYEKFQPAGEVKPPQWEVLQRFAIVRLFDDQDEQNRIAATVEDEPTSAGIKRYGIAEYVGGGYRALDRFENGQAAHPLAVAMLRAAADWRRLGFEAIPAATMSALAPAYLSDKLRTAPGEDETAAQEWASTEFGGRIKLLEPAGSGAWRVFDYLLDYLTNEGSPVPDTTWTIAAEAARANPRQASLLGYRAYLDGRIELATSLWQVAATGVPAAAFNLGLLRSQQGDPDGAAAAYKLAIDTGHPIHSPMAAVNLGALREEQGDSDGAATAYQLAIDTGHPDQSPNAALGLGALRKEQGDSDGAAAAYQLAIDTGHPDMAPKAAFNLGLLRAEYGNPDGAVTAYQLAIDTGHPDAAPMAAVNLGALRKEQGDPDGAVTAYQLAIDTGHPDAAPMAAVNLGALRKEQGDPDGAAAAYKLTIDTGHPDHAPEAAFNLGVLRQEQGDLDAAAAAYQLAINIGKPAVAAVAQAALDRLRPT